MVVVNAGDMLQAVQAQPRVRSFCLCFARERASPGSSAHVFSLVAGCVCGDCGGGLLWG